MSLVGFLFLIQVGTRFEIGIENGNKGVETYSGISLVPSEELSKVELFIWHLVIIAWSDSLVHQAHNDVSESFIKEGRIVMESIE